MLKWSSCLPKSSQSEIAGSRVLTYKCTHREHNSVYNTSSVAFFPISVTKTTTVNSSYGITVTCKSGEPLQWALLSLLIALLTVRNMKEVYEQTNIRIAQQFLFILRQLKILMRKSTYFLWCVGLESLMQIGSPCKWGGMQSKFGVGV